MGLKCTGSRRLGTEHGRLDAEPGPDGAVVGVRGDGRTRYAARCLCALPAT